MDISDGSKNSGASAGSVKSGAYARLSRSRTAIKASYIGVAVLLVIAIVVPYYFYYNEFKGDTSFYLLYLVLPLCLAFGAAVWFIRYKVEPNIRRMTGLLKSADPISLILWGMGPDWRGRETIALRYPDSPTSEEPWNLVRINTPNEGAYFRKNEALPVIVYHDPNDGFVIVDTGRQLLWGGIVSPEDQFPG